MVRPGRPSVGNDIHSPKLRQSRAPWLARVSHVRQPLERLDVVRDIRDLRGHDLFRRFVLLNAMMTRPTEFPERHMAKSAGASYGIALDGKPRSYRDVLRRAVSFWNHTDDAIVRSIRI